MTSKKEISWEYLSIHKEEFGDKYIEIFEYCGKYMVNIGRCNRGSVDVLETEDSYNAWVLFNNLVSCFDVSYGDGE